MNEHPPNLPRATPPVAGGLSASAILNYYSSNFFPLFALSTAVSGALPEQMLNELRNCLDHLAKAEIGHDPIVDLGKARNHLDRACLDCVKIVWKVQKDEVQKVYNQFTPKEYCLVDGGRFWATLSGLYSSFKETSRIARLEEPRQINSDISPVINGYIDAIEVGESILALIGQRTPDIQHNIQLYRKKICQKDIWLIAITAVLSVLISEGVQHFISLYLGP